MRAQIQSLRLTASAPWTVAISAYGLFALSVVIICFVSFSSMTHTWLTSSAYNHAIVIPPLTLFLIWSKRSSIADLTPEIWLAAATGIAVFSSVWLAGRSHDAQIIEHFAITGLLISGVALIFGKELTSAWSFPLAFLFFMVPFGESLTPFLRDVTASATTILLNIAGVSAALNDLIITTSGGRFHIAEGCAGLHFLLAALIVASLFSYYAFTSWRKRFYFLGVAVATAIGANILRVFLVIFIATQTNGVSTVVEDHLFLGWIFYGLALGALIFTGLRYADHPDAA